MLNKCCKKVTKIYIHTEEEENYEKYIKWEKKRTMTNKCCKKTMKDGKQTLQNKK